MGRGFERYYGFLGGDTHQYYPELVYDNHGVEPEKTPEEGYHLTEDLIDKAIGVHRRLQAGRAQQTVLHVLLPRRRRMRRTTSRRSGRTSTRASSTTAGTRIGRRRSSARRSWALIPQDAELSRHDPDVQDWNTLSAGEKKLYARMMEVFAGFLTHTDYHYGRLFEFLKDIGECDNTLIMFISDNGASSEGGPSGSVNENKFFNNVPDSLEQNLAMIDELGGPKTFNHYAWGWTFAGNTPFRRWKRETYRGGISDPFIVHWPKGIKAKGEVRTQYAHAIDMVPTVLEALGIEAPDFDQGRDAVADRGPQLCPRARRRKAAPSKHITQYFEMMGHRSIYHDGWRAVCPWPGTSFKEAGVFFGAPIDKDKLTELDAKGWELYHVEKDFAENHNLAVRRTGRS